jgi:hypothetical protein
VSFRRHACVALSWLKLHHPHCDHCAAQDCRGLTIGRRLRELNEQAQRTHERNAAGKLSTTDKDAA